MRSALTCKTAFVALCVLAALLSLYAVFPEACADTGNNRAGQSAGVFAPCAEPVNAPPTVDLPFIGQEDASKVSLPLLAIVLGAVDGFNPCAFFVLFFLLSLLIHAGSRGRMLVVGGVFVFFSGAIYFLFMSAWLNIFLLTGHLSLITVAAGVIALAAAVINIKDFFLFGKGVSLVIPESAKPGLFARMRGLIKATSPVSMVMGAVVLAVTSNAYELLCTAGFPMVFTRVLTLNRLGMAEYYFYLALYNAVYVVPLATIVIVFTVTLGARKLTEWQGRVLKLVSGTMMLGMGLVLLIKPAVLVNPVFAILLLAGSLAASGVAASLTKKSATEG